MQVLLFTWPYFLHDTSYHPSIKLRLKTLFIFFILPRENPPNLTKLDFSVLTLKYKNIIYTLKAFIL